MMARNPALRDHVVAGLLDVAARVLEERGEKANMTEIAEAAGISRATLYRYFPNRDALVDELRAVALADLAARIADTQVDGVPVREALARLTRALIGAVSRHRTLARFQQPAEDKAAVELQMVEPLRRLLVRAQEEGALRADLPMPFLVDAYTGLVRSVVNQLREGTMGVEQAGAAVTALFLDGALDHG